MAWLEGADNEQFQYMTDDEIIVAVQDSDDERGKGVEPAQMPPLLSLTQ